MEIDIKIDLMPVLSERKTHRLVATLHQGDDGQGDDADRCPNHVFHWNRHPGGTKTFQLIQLVFTNKSPDSECFSENLSSQQTKHRILWSPSQSGLNTHPLTIQTIQTMTRGESRLQPGAALKRELTRREILPPFSSTPCLLTSTDSWKIYKR